MEREARFFGEKTETGIRCILCPNRCEIPDGSFGACGVRGNRDGKGVIPFYGHVTALALDPIEKKPLFHFRPGSEILSVGFAGCNLRCPFCQNWRISRGPSSGASVPGERVTPAEIVSTAIDKGSRAIAYTYSEPLVHAEFLLDCMSLARERGIANVLVTNGCVEPEAAHEILSLTDAANIDLKCFSKDTYAQTLGGDMETVLAFIRLAQSKKVHVELTTLVVPGMNDSPEELDACADFIFPLNTYHEAELFEIPWHLSAYHPNYQWKAPSTDPEVLLDAKKRAKNKLMYVYTGNIPGEENNTFCDHCGVLLVRRLGYRTETFGLEVVEGELLYRCERCGGPTCIVC